MDMVALAVSAVCNERSATFYAPAASVRPGHVLVQPCVEGANALAFTLEEQLAYAKQFGMRALYAVRVKSKPCCA